MLSTLACVRLNKFACFKLNYSLFVLLWQCFLSFCILLHDFFMCSFTSFSLAFSLVENQEIFKMRTRMMDVKENMKGKHIKFHCEACYLEGIKIKETQKHVYKCKHLNTKVKQINTKKYLAAKYQRQRKSLK